MDIKQKQIPSDGQKILLRALAESVANPGCKFLEVGSWCGDSARILGKIAQENGGYLFCVDWWKGNVGTDLANIAKKEDIFSLFWKNMCREGLEDVVVPIRANSDVASLILKDHVFELVFLDGDHRFEATLNDIKKYAPLVRKENGILCGHDCDGYISDFDMDLIENGKNLDTYKNIHCGVVLAVGTAFKNYSIDHNIWSIKSSIIDQGWQPTNITFPAPIKLIEEGYEEFNIIKFGENFYALAQGLGSVDFNDANIDNLLQEYCDKSQCFIASSVSEAKRLVARYYSNAFKTSLADNLKIIEALKQDISCRDEDIIKLNKDIDECRADIEVLREAIFSKEKMMEALKDDVLRRDESIKNLKEELSFIKSKWWFRLFNGRSDNKNKNMKENL